MGSSPVTATISSSGALAEAVVVGALRSCLREHGVAAGEPIVVAFSGGPDSLALLLAAARLAPEIGARVVAAHVDHRLDPGSAPRAGGAGRRAEQRDGPFHLLGGADIEAQGESREAAGRRLRYRLLDDLRRELDARWVLTAHHADDQAETVLLRRAHGSGLAGLAGMATRHGTILRPFLSLSREQLLAALDAADLWPLEDPTNSDLTVPRNLLRHHLLPALGGEE